MPSLLEERNKEVDGQDEVSLEVRLSHVDVTDGDTEAEDLLELELDGRLDLVDLGLDVISVRDGGGEHTHLVELRADETRDGLDEGISGQKGIIAGSPLLDRLLLLVELLQVISADSVDLEVLGDIEVLLISNDAHLSLRAGLLGQNIRTSETLILLHSRQPNRKHDEGRKRGRKPHAKVRHRFALSNQIHHILRHERT